MKFIVILTLNSVLGSGPRLIQKPENTEVNIGDTGIVLIQFNFHEINDENDGWSHGIHVIFRLQIILNFDWIGGRALELTA